jgi:transglutaminase-like putative cysteine protease
MSRERALLVGGVACIPILWNWMRLEDPSSAGRAALLVLLALAPAAILHRNLRFAAAAVALVIGAGTAFHVVLGLHYFGRTGVRLWDGFLEFYDVKLPFAPVEHPHMDGAILFAVFVFCAFAVLAVCERRPGLAAMAVLVGAGWPATLLRGSELTRGAGILAALLVIFAGLRRRPDVSGRAVLVGGAIILAGVGAASSPALAKGEFLHWQTWDLHVPNVKPVSVSYVWSSDYSGLTFPHKTTVVLHVKAPKRPQYWRVTTLPYVVNGHWLDQPSFDSSTDAGLVPPSAASHSNWVEQRITVAALRENRLPAAEEPMAFDPSGLGSINFDSTGVAYLDSGVLHSGESYRAWSYEPKPTPQQLARSRPVYPPSITLGRRYLEVNPNELAPTFGTPDREVVLNKMFAANAQLRAYKPLYATARSIAGGARSPYAAAVALESWFRTGGGFAYNQHPPPAHGKPALVDFVTHTRAGYCQHFAGAMALMLRYLGVPARIAAGFSSGRYDNGEWTVTDHDAHEWVEVWFRGWGWVPFDPTPSRGGVAGAYSASSRAFNLAVAAAILAGKDGLKSFANRRVGLGFPDTQTKFSADIRLSRSPSPVSLTSEQHSPAPGLLRVLFLLLAALIVLIAGIKFALRRARYLTSDPRRLAAACRRELHDILVDQRVEVSPTATVAELAALTQEELGVETAGLGMHATVARFAPPGYAREAARELRVSLKRLRKSLRQELSHWDRARGLLSLRSLGLS